MINALFSLIIFAIVAGLLYWLVLQLPIPEPFLTMVKIGVVLICILVLVGVLTGGVPLPYLGFRG